MDNRPIGVFDSGLGGLTVFREITAALPGESIVYFGDSGRAPYGTKSRDTVIKYTFQDINFLKSRNIKMIVIACNTISAYSYEKVRQSLDIPIVEVIGPGAVTAVRETSNGKVGVIATPATIGSGAYEKAINGIDSGISVHSKACPLFVPLVEEGQWWWENDISHRVAEEYLKDLKDSDIDTLVLGCTHYPLLANTISHVVGKKVKLVNSALEVAKVVKQMIHDNNMERDEGLVPEYSYYTSDSVEKFKTLCSIILNHAVCSAEKVDIDKY